MTQYGQLAGKFLKNQKKRTILTISGVILSVALITGTGTIIESIKQMTIERTIRDVGNFHICFKDISRKQAEIVKNHIDIEKSSFGKIAGFAVIGEVSQDEQSLRKGAPPYRLLRLHQNDSNAMKMLQTEKQLTEGRLPGRRGEIAIDARAKTILGGDINIGSTITLPVGQRRLTSDNSIITKYNYPYSEKEGGEIQNEYFVETGYQNFVITGFITDGVFISGNYSSNAVVYADLGNSDNSELINMVALLTNMDNIKEKAETIAENAGIPLENILYNDTLLYLQGKGLNKNYNSAVIGFNIIVVLIIVIATIAVIYNSFNISMIEQISQLGILRCIGATPGQIKQMILQEATVIGVIGVPVGIFFGLFSMKLVFYIISLFSPEFFLSDKRVVISSSVIISSALIGFITVFFSALFPAIKAGRIPAIEAVRSTGMYSHDRIGKVKKSRKYQRLISFPLLMAIRNISRNRKRFIITLFSMIISVTLYISFSGMMRLVDDSNIYADPDLPGFSVESKAYIGENVHREIISLECVETAFKILRHNTDFLINENKLSGLYKEVVDKLPSFVLKNEYYTIPDCRILSYGDAAFPILEKSVAPGSIDPDKMEKENGIVLIQKGFFRDKEGVRVYGANGTFKIGDKIKLAGSINTSMAIIAIMDNPIYDDYNQVEGGFDIVVTENQFKKLTGSNNYQELYLKIRNGYDKTSLNNYLDNLISTNIEYSYVDTQAIAEKFNKDTMAMKILFFGFIAIIALIGCLNIVNTISTNLIVRTRELGIMQAVGLDRRNLRDMVLNESIIYSINALVIGGILGSVLRYIILNIVGQAVRIPFSIPWMEIGFAAVGLILISLTATFYPLRRISSQSIIESIRREE